MLLLVVRYTPVVHPDAQHRAQLTSSGNSGTDVVRFHPAGHALLRVMDQNRGHLRVSTFVASRSLWTRSIALPAIRRAMPADPLGFGQPGHNVADGVPLQDPSSSLTDADLVFGLGGHGYLCVATIDC